MSEVNTIRKLADLWKSRVTDVLIIVVLVAVATSWIWLPLTVAQLTYGDWTCAYKECVVIINGDNKAKEEE